MKTYRIQLYSTLLLGFSIFGCSGGDGISVAPVSGLVTKAGVPVPNVSVTFYPEEGRQSIATTGDDGRFELIYSNDKDGAVVGAHTVSFRIGGSMPRSEPGMPVTKPDAKQTGKPAPAETIEWDEKVIVLDEGNDFTFDLK